MVFKRIILADEFLGHIYLSGHDKELAVGNLVADQIKTIKFQNYQIK